MNKIIIFTVIIISIFRISLGFATSSTPTPTDTSISSPLVMLKKTSNEVIEQLKTHPEELKKNPAIAYNIINTILIPHVDLHGICQKTLGPTWTKATSDQQKRFMEEYKNLLIATYSVALSSYKDQKIKFYPIRGSYKGLKKVRVKSEIILEDAPSIPVDYLVNIVGNEWKVVDISVDGISLLESFRAQFADELKQGGIEGLIKLLHQHNQKKNR